MKFTKYFLLAPFLLIIEAANARWMYLETGGAFDDKPTHVIATVSLGYSLGFRCKDNKSLELIYGTTENAEGSKKEELLRSLNKIDPELLVRIDDNKTLTIETTMTRMQSNVGALSSVQDDVLRQLINANRRISVAVKLAGNLVHEHEFSVTGSTQSGNQLAKNCGLLEEIE